MMATAKVELKLLLTTASTSATTSKELIEYVLVAMPSEMPVRVLSLSMPLQTLLAMLIVHLLLLGVTERLVGVCDILELLLGALRIVLVLVRVKLDGKLLEGLLNLLICRTTLQTQLRIQVRLLTGGQGCGQNDKTKKR